MHYDLTNVKDHHPDYSVLGFTREIIEPSPTSGVEVHHDVLYDRKYTDMAERWYIDPESDLSLTAFVYEDGTIEVEDIFKYRTDTGTMLHRINRIIDNLELLKQIIEEEIGDAKG